MSKFRLSNVTGNRREWFLPVVLFFVVMFAIARAVLEQRRGVSTWFILKPLGFWPLLVALVGIAGIAMSWYFRGTLQHPLRKVLAVALLALPVAGFLGLRSEATTGLSPGGAAGQHLGTALGVLPSFLANTFAILLVLGSAWLAWRLAFSAGSSHPVSTGDALARALQHSPAGDRKAREAEDGLEDDDFPLEPPTLVSPPKREVKAAEAPTVWSAPARSAVAIASIPKPDSEEEAALATAEPEAFSFLPQFGLETTDSPLDPEENQGAEVAEVAFTAEESPAPEEFDEFRDPVPAPLLADLETGDEAEVEPIPELLIQAETDSTLAPHGDARWGALERLELALAARRAQGRAEVAAQTDQEQGRLADATAAPEFAAQSADPESMAGTEEAVLAQDAVLDEVTDEIESPAAEIWAARPAAAQESSNYAESEAFGEGIGAEFEEFAEPEVESAPAAAEPAEREPARASWSLLRGMPEVGEPTVVLPRFGASPEPESATESRSDRLPSEAEPPSRGRAPRVRRRTTEDWEAWNEASGSRPNSRRPGVAAQAADEDQQVLFSAPLDETLYRRAVEQVLAEERCSVVMLQREFDLSWSTAFAITERMHDEGLVGPPLPSGRREVLGLRRARTEIDATET